ncbi:MAG: helix-turn-helix domain-containing protein [Halobacteria archaeon]|nr:helix-turn-helix domain-containing protein [Halobacteria archaeon]
MSEESDDSQSLEDKLSNLPPSAKLVVKILEYEGPLSQKTISERSRLPSRTTRSALKQLMENDIVESRPSLTDGRCNIYRLSLPESQEEEIETVET